MISNYNLDCGYHNFELKDKIYLVPDYALKVIYTDGFNEVVYQGDSSNVTLLEGHEITFQEETSFDERFKFSKSVSIKVNGYKTFNDLDYRYCVVLETKEGEFYLVNVDFPSFVTHTYTLNNGTNSTELVFSSQSNIATLKLTNFEPNNVNTCKEYSNAKIKNVKLTEAWASSLSTWQKSLVNNGSFVDIEPLQDSVNLIEEFDGEKYTVTLGFDIPMSYYKNDWHLKLLRFEDNKYRGYISLEDGNKAFVGYNVGLFPSYAINGDIISIRLTETSIRGIAYGNDYAIIRSNIPNTVDFTGSTCYRYDFMSSCDWEVEDKPDYITISPMSGNADTLYELTICNTDDETGYAVSEFVISTCNAVIKPEVIIRNAIYRYQKTNDTACTEVTNERWIESGTTCVGVDKYSRDIEQISYDSAQNWYNTGNESATTLIEVKSEDCGYSARTLVTTVCGGVHDVDKYEVTENQETFDYGATWNTISSSSTLVEMNSADCGYAEKWVDSGTTCVNYDKYVNSIKFVSYNFGETWYNTGIESATTLIEVKSEDCGYGAKYILTLDDSSVVSAECDYSHSISYDDTWSYKANTVSAAIGNCITEIDAITFYIFRSLSSVTLGNNVATIGDKAFEDCDNLTGITIPDSVTSLGAEAFYRCPSLSSVTIGTGLTEIQSQTFAFSGVKEIVIPGNVVTIGSSAFYYSDLTNAVLENGVTIIDNRAFSDCGSLSSITIPSSVTQIGRQAFANCASLTGVTIPYRISIINSQTFGWCHSLTNIIIPDNVRTIDGGAFMYCSSLSSVTFGNSILTIGENAFTYCGLTNLVIPDTVTSIGVRIFNGCSSLTGVTIGSGITEIPTEAFAGCSSLTDIAIPDNITKIGSNAFSRCSGLTNVTVGSAVTIIDTNAFSDCSSISSFTIYATTPPTLGANYGGLVWSNCNFYVPAASVDTYKTAWDWEFFASRIFPIS